jgi:hypothetical protein
MRFRVPFAALSLVICVAMIASSPQTTITVAVKNQYDKPVDNATVILDFKGSRQVLKGGMKKDIHWEVHTNLEGIAHFPPIPQGTIQLQVSKMPQYQTFGEKFDLDTAEKKIDIKLNPPQKQYSAHPPLKPADPPPKQ